VSATPCVRRRRNRSSRSPPTRDPRSWPRTAGPSLRPMFSVRSPRRSSRAGPHRQPGTKPSPVSAVRSRDYAAFLNCSNRSANRSRSGRSLLRRGNWINCPTIPLRPSSRNGPSWISSSRSETWIRKSGSIPIRCASKAAWWIFVNGRPFEITGCPNCSSASMMM
jgi:hypothetical protein